MTALNSTQFIEISDDSQQSDQNTDASESNGQPNGIVLTVYLTPDIANVRIINNLIIPVRELNQSVDSLHLNTSMGTVVDESLNISVDTEESIAWMYGIKWPNGQPYGCAFSINKCTTLSLLFVN